MSLVHDFWDKWSSPEDENWVEDIDVTAELEEDLTEDDLEEDTSSEYDIADCEECDEHSWTAYFQDLDDLEQHLERYLDFRE